MKTTSYLAVAFLFFCVVLSVNLLQLSAVEIREWKSADGKFKVEAKFVEQSADDVTIERKDGKKIKVPKAKLGAGDQTYLKEMEKQGAKGSKKSDLETFGQDEGEAPRDTKPDPKRATPPATENKNSPPKEKKDNPSNEPPVITENQFIGETLEARQERIKKLAIEDANFDPSDIIKQIHEPHTAPDFKTYYEFDYSEFRIRPDLYFSDDGTHLAMNMHGDKKDSVVFIDMQKKTEIRRFEYDGIDVRMVMSKSGKYFALCGQDQLVKVYHTDKDEVLYEHNAVAKADKEVRSVWFDPSETHILFLDDKRRLYRFPVGGGLGASYEIPADLCSDEYLPSLPNSISCSHTGNSVYVASRHPSGKKTGRSSMWAATAEFAYGDDTPGVTEVKVESKIFSLPLQECVTTNIISYPLGVLGLTDVAIVSQSFRKTPDGVMSFQQTIPFRGFLPKSIHHIASNEPNNFGYALSAGSSPGGQKGYLLNYVYLHEEVPILSLMTPDAKDGYLHYDSMCNDGSIAQFSDKERKLRILRATKTPQHAAWKLLEFTKKAQREGRYVQLERLGKELLKDTKPIANLEFETAHHFWLSLITNASGLGPKQHFQCMAEWKQIVPETSYPDMVRTSELLSLAWAARGTGFANTVSEENFKKFHANSYDAYTIIKEVVKKEDAPPEVYERLFACAQALSWKLEEYEPHISELMRKAPTNSFAHNQLATSLLPRWFGGPGDSAKYAEKVADAVGGEEGDMIYAKITHSLSRMHSSGTFYNETELSIDRALAGCDALCKKYPESGIGQFMGMALIFHHPDPNTYLTHLNRYGEHFLDNDIQGGHFEDVKWLNLPINMAGIKNFLYYRQEIRKMNGK